MYFESNTEREERYEIQRFPHFFWLEVFLRVVAFLQFLILWRASSAERDSGLELLRTKPGGPPTRGALPGLRGAEARWGEEEGLALCWRWSRREEEEAVVLAEAAPSPSSSWCLCCCCWRSCVRCWRDLICVRLTRRARRWESLRETGREGTEWAVKKIESTAWRNWN